MDQKDRDNLGRFQEGHKSFYSPTKAPDEIPEMHPTIAYRDTKGRMLPGCTTNGRSPLPVKVAELKKSMLEAVSPDQIQRTIFALWAMTIDPEQTPHVRLAATDLFLTRILGKPTQEMILHQEKVTTKVNLDLTKLTQDELQQLMELQNKAQPKMVDAEVVDPEANGSKN